jgi:mycothiol synthase
MNDLPQLRMRHALKAVPSRRELRVDCLLREAVRADADGIAHVLQNAFNEPWDASRVFRDLFDDPNVPVTFVISQGSEIVATASYQLKEDPDPEAGWVHWVGVHPDARGSALGEIVSHRVLSEAAERKRNCVYLTTDDFRLAAIVTYCRLGFEADCCHETHLPRWQAIRTKLAVSVEDRAKL